MLLLERVVLVLDGITMYTLIVYSGLLCISITNFACKLFHKSVVLQGPLKSWQKESDTGKNPGKWFSELPGGFKVRLMVKQLTIT